MVKSAKSKAKNKSNIICRHGKKCALRSPLALDSSELCFDPESGSLMLSIIIANTSTDENPISVESAGLVIRCFDSAGNLIVSNGREIISKTLKFPEEGLSSGASVGIKTKIDLSPELVADFDVYIGCIRTTGLLVIDFVRGDFFEAPGEPLLLSAGMTEEEIYDVCDKVSDSATYYPDELSPLVWRCTCGEINDSSVCPKCGAERKELFGFFANLSRPALGGDLEEKGRKRLHVIIAILSALFFVVTLALVIFLIAFLAGDDGGLSDPPPVDDSTLDDEEKEATLEEKLARLEALMNENKFSEALALAKSDKALSGKIKDISEGAIQYYVSINEYDSALTYTENLSDPVSANQNIRLSGYDYYIENSVLDKALEYANALADREKINNVYMLKIDALLAEKKYSEAVKVAVDAELESKKEEIISIAIADYSSNGDYDRALEIALLSNIENVPEDVSREATYYYLEQNDIESVLRFAEHVNDPELMQDVASKLTDTQLRENLGTFFKHLSLERKQSLYAVSVSVGKQAAMIRADGSVVYGSGSVYTPEEGIKAVSVKASAHHTVILLSDGTVVAFGDNSFSQCSVGLWNGVVAIDVGEYHTVALLEDGTVKACGNKAFEQCSVSNYKNVIMIAAGDFHTLVLMADGTVESTGLGTSGQCNTHTWKNITFISAGSLHSVAITYEGKVLAVGSPSLGRCDVSKWENVSYISAGSSHTVAILKDGTVVSCGGVVGTGSYGGDTVYDEEIVYIDAGNTCTVAVTASGKLVFSGDGLPVVSHIENETVDSYCFFTSQN